MHFYCSEHLRAALFCKSHLCIRIILSLVLIPTLHIFIGDDLWMYTSQSKHCIKSCRLNSTDSIWKHFRSCWAGEELKIWPEGCRWSWVTQDCTLDYSYQVNHKGWEPVNTLCTSFDWEEVWFNVFRRRRRKMLHLIPSREEKFSPKRF